MRLRTSLTPGSGAERSSQACDRRCRLHRRGPVPDVEGQMRIVRKQERVMGRMLVRTPAMDTRIPPEEVWVRSDALAPDESPSQELVERLIKKNPGNACDGCA